MASVIANSLVIGYRPTLNLFDRYYRNFSEHNFDMAKYSIFVILVTDYEFSCPNSAY